MNCIDVRRRLLTEPAVVDVAIQAHLQGCSACARFAHQLLDFEHGLKQAAQIEVPEGLAARIVLQQRLHGQRRQRHWQWLALAASVLLGVALLSQLYLRPTPLTLEASVLAHIEQELPHLQERNGVRIAELNAVLAPQGVRIESLRRQVHYAGACQMRQQQGAHLVFDSPTGPVTVLLMPGEHLAVRHTIKNQQYHGVIVPMAMGSMAIVGQDAEQLHVLEQELKAGMHTLS